MTVKHIQYNVWLFFVFFVFYIFINFLIAQFIPLCSFLKLIY